jgi:multiple sugar transport system permease protein
MTVLTPHAPSHTRPKTTSMQRKEWRSAAIFLLPNLAGISIFVILPVIAGLVVSFTNWDLLGTPEWIGFANYAMLWNDEIFWTSLRHTLVYTVIAIPGGLTLSLLLALALKGHLRGTAFYQAVFFLPYISSTVAIALVWKWIYNPDFGILNLMLKSLGLPAPNWLGDPGLALLSLAIISIWQTTGYNVVLFIAGLRAIPEHYYEAARIDGAGPVRVFFRITLPLLLPTIFFVTATSLIASFQVFNLVYVTTNGGPGNSTNVLVLYLWENGFSFFKMGYASAMAYVLFILILGITLIQVYAMGRRTQQFR